MKVPSFIDCAAQATKVEKSFANCIAAAIFVVIKPSKGQLLPFLVGAGLTPLTEQT